MAKKEGEDVEEWRTYLSLSFCVSLVPGSALDTMGERQSDGDGARCGAGRKAAETAAGGRKEERRDTAPWSGAGAAARAAMAGACSSPRAPLNREGV